MNYCFPSKNYSVKDRLIKPKVARNYDSSFVIIIDLD